MSLKDKKVRQGSSQKGRNIAALDTSYVSVEERSTEDLLKFVLQFARQLKFYNNNDQHDGDWSLFFGGDPELTGSGLNANEQQYVADCADYLENPDKYASDSSKLALHSAPHRVLLSVYLKLLDYSKQQFAGLTQRHLDYYYREVLKLSEKSAKPDQIYAVFELNAGETKQLLQKNTALDGGQDSADNPLLYTLDEDIVVNQARVARVYTLGAQKEANNLPLIPRAVFAKDNINFPETFSTFGETARSPTNTGEVFPDYYPSFAISSPLLLLKEGEREISLRLTFSEPYGSAIIIGASRFFKIEFSGGADLPWFNSERDGITIEVETSSQWIEYKIKLKKSVPAILPPVADTASLSLAQPLTSLDPLIRFSVTDDIKDVSEGNPLYDFYQAFSRLRLQQVTLEVNVTGLKDLVLRNDDGVLDPKKAILPFGQNPHKQAGLYIANDEISQKSIKSMMFNLEWTKLPGKFNSKDGYYQNYKDIDGEPITVIYTDFKTELQVFNNRVSNTLGSKELFQVDSEKLNSVSRLSYNFADNAVKIIGITNTNLEDPFEWKRYFKLALTGKHATFLQDAYVVALQSLGQGEKINPPYIPQISDISIGYSAMASVDLLDSAATPASIQILHAHPFGQIDLQKTGLSTDAQNNTAGYPLLLPQYNDIEGHLYIGIENLQDKQAVSLLIHMDPGSENPDINSPDISWRYLSDDRWIPFNDDEIVSNSTDGLLQTGIIRFHPPSSATTKHYLLPTEYHWFEARVAGNTSAIPNSINITTQAVTATHVLQDPASDHLTTALPANSVTKLVNSNPAISSVKQPLNSFGGKAQENNAQFTKRSSERLRHKQRAISMWDYEHLILEKFPDIHQVKCLNQTAQEQDPAAAKVKLLLIPNLSNRSSAFPLQPKLSQALRSQVKKYVQDKCSPFVDVDVVKPRFEEIRYRITVRFKQKERAGYFIKKLNGDIIRYLSPWAYGDQADIAFNGVVYRSSLFHFITHLPYVDFVGKVTLIDHHLIRKNSDGVMSKQPFTLDQEVAKTHSADAILVSSPSHYIELVTEDYEAIHFNGIGYMEVDVDFNVA